MSIARRKDIKAVNLSEEDFKIVKNEQIDKAKVSRLFVVMAILFVATFVAIVVSAVFKSIIAVVVFGIAFVLLVVLSCIFMLPKKQIDMFDILESPHKKTATAVVIERKIIERVMVDNKISYFKFKVVVKFDGSGEFADGVIENIVPKIQQRYEVVFVETNPEFCVVQEATQGYNE